jgi:hypothetical protein
VTELGVKGKNMTEADITLFAILVTLFFIELNYDGNKTINKKIDFLFKHLDLTMLDIASNEVRKHVKQGRKIEAPKLLRQETGMGLKEAKEIIEEIEKSLNKVG